MPHDEYRNSSDMYPCAYCKDDYNMDTLGYKLASQPMESVIIFRKSAHVK